MATLQNVFSPSPTGTMILAVTTTSAQVTLTGIGDGPVAVTSASGGALAFIRFGTGTVTALDPTSAAGDYPILPGTTQILDRGSSTVAAAITHASTATLYFTTGQGG